MNLSTKNLRFDHVVALQKTLKKCLLFAYNRSMGILRRSLYVGIALLVPRAGGVGTVAGIGVPIRSGVPHASAVRQAVTGVLTGQL